MGKHRKNISISKDLEESMKMEADRLNTDFSDLIRICWEHYSARKSDEDIITYLFKKRK